MTLLAARPRADREALKTLLGSDPDAAVTAVLNRVEAAMAHTNGVVLVGAAQLGRWLARELPRVGVDVHCLADNSDRFGGRDVDGFAVLKPPDAVTRYPDATFVVTVFSPAVLLAQLHGLGATSVIPWTWLAWSKPANLLPYYDFDLPHGMVEAAPDVLRAFDLFTDETSRNTLIDQVRWRLTLDEGAQGAHAPITDIYFEPGVCMPTADDVYVDCGAFDGDTIADYLRRTGGKTAGIIAIEADPTSLEPLRRRVDALPADIAERVVIHPLAVGAERGQLAFRADGTISSGFHEGTERDGHVRLVDVTTLDALLADTGASYVKMDIEGAEPMALAGAARTLRAGRTVWASCLYHVPDHLWSVPLQIAGSGGDYRHSLRRYAPDCWELVHYAVPAGRS